MATSWDVAAAGWFITVFGWLLSPVIRSVLPKILSYLSFDASQKLWELEIHILPELENTLRVVDQERMMQRGDKVKSDVAVLDKMAARLRHAREDAEDIFDDSQTKIVAGDIFYRLVKTCIAYFNTSCLWIACFIESGSTWLLQLLRRSFVFLRRRSEAPGPVTNDIAASDEPAAAVASSTVDASDQLATVTIDIRSSCRSLDSDEPSIPEAAPLDSSGRWLSFDVFKSYCRSIFNWLVDAIETAHSYRDWSYNVVGITSYQENVGVLDCLLIAISRRNLKKRIEKVESTATEVKKSPLLGVANKSAQEDIANKNRSRIRTASNRRVFGRKPLLDTIMAKLRNTEHDDVSSSSTSQCYSVIGIYGVTGSGKTTFARYIRDFIEEECKEEKLFDTIICIHVSETFSVDDIFHDMLKDITKDAHLHISDREELEKMLKKSLDGKRFFLILDDLWVKSKTNPQLEELLDPLNVGMKGSKILVTARTTDAARAARADILIEIPDLDKGEYLNMLMHYALDGTNIPQKPFLPVGRKIAERLRGSPIAAVTVGGQLGANPTISYWESIVKLDVLDRPMDALYWSYQQLNLDIRRCFAFCHIFPTRFKLRKVELVRLWIAHGMVKTSNEAEDMEDVAEGYIQVLVSVSFLQPEQTSDGTDNFTIHDLLHDLLNKVTGNDYFRIENEMIQRGQGWKGDVPRDVRHLFIHLYDAELITEKIIRYVNLRTLIIYVVGRDSPVEERVIQTICKRLTKLRVLAVALSQEHRAINQPKKFWVPESIGQLKHLGYLAFRTGPSCEVILPSALSKVQHIQLLDFGDGRVSEFTSASLINLRHIICKSMGIPNISWLISLQTIPDFTVRDKQGYKVKQLRDLNKLRGRLRICGLDTVKSKEEALEANLAAKERLTELKLRWSYDYDKRGSPEVVAEVLEGLCPPAGLQILSIEGYRGSRYPDWMVSKRNGGPKDLRELQLWECSHLGPAPQLVEAFPRLSVLQFCYCSLDIIPANMEGLTTLKKLLIFGCMSIRSLPTLPPSLEEFRLIYCDDELMKSCQTVGDPNWQKVEHIPNKKFSPGK